MGVGVSAYKMMVKGGPIVSSQINKRYTPSLRHKNTTSSSTGVEKSVNDGMVYGK